ncbi:hypothetical protein [Phytoactinopolyspora halophila]|uniref:hypothetical protein n=1 Tax=Phytoactinopolyspora halophila TaxID=1981511 RepID=UPI000F4E31B6|nr:hypothetical protein [Phytoactinopolyspora halophila]
MTRAVGGRSRARGVDVALDDGSALQALDTGEESPGVTLDEVFCVQDEFAVPEPTMSGVTSRRAQPW